jgi:hypothetical protein
MTILYEAYYSKVQAQKIMHEDDKSLYYKTKSVTFQIYYGCFSTIQALTYFVFSLILFSDSTWVFGNEAR